MMRKISKIWYNTIYKVVVQMKKVIKGENDVFSLHPELTRQE